VCPMERFPYARRLLPICPPGTTTTGAPAIRRCTGVAAALTVRFDCLATDAIDPASSSWPFAHENNFVAATAADPPTSTADNMSLINVANQAPASGPTTTFRAGIAPPTRFRESGSRRRSGQWRLPPASIVW